MCNFSIHAKLKYRFCENKIVDVFFNSLPKINEFWENFEVVFIYLIDSQRVEKFNYLIDHICIYQLHMKTKFSDV